MIKSIKARKILNSRGEFTVEVNLKTDKGVFKASVPSGASTGKTEDLAIDTSLAVENVNKIISSALIGKNPENQKEIDELMINLDGTENKSKLGANAILPVSIAVCRAGAASKGLPLYRYIAESFNFNIKLPMPCFNIINGGKHATGGLAIQEIMVVPSAGSFAKNFLIGKKVYKNLKKILRNKFGKQGIKIGDEAGFVPPFSKVEEALDMLLEAAGKENIKIGIDCAAAQFTKEKYDVNFYSQLVSKYPLVFIEDPFAEDDWQNFSEITEKLGSKIAIVGDDLLTTDVKRMKIAKERSACNGVIIKPNQIGTVSETIEAIKLAKSYNWKIIVSHRSGETKDDFVADLAAGIGADFIKSGAPKTKYRLAKYERLLEIEKGIFEIVF